MDYSSMDHMSMSMSMSMSPMISSAVSQAMSSMMPSMTSSMMAMPTVSPADHSHEHDHSSMTDSGMARMAGMDHSGHDHSSMGGGGCKISMMWNWNTIDACFITQDWHIKSKGMFAGSCIGVICLVMLLEFLRRLSLEYDRSTEGQSLLNKWWPSVFGASVTSARQQPLLFRPDPDAKDPAQHAHPETGPTAATGSFAAQRQQQRWHTSLLQHTVHSFLHVCQFAVAYFTMLLAMYYNGYIIICIFIGAFLGHWLFSWKDRALDAEE